MEILQPKVRRDLSGGWTYSKEACRLLRRHPSLLLIPVCLALFNAIENGVGRQLASTHTAYGRALSARLRTAEQKAPPRHGFTLAGPSLSTAYWSAKQVSFLHAVNLLTSAAFRPSLAGTQTLAYTAATEPGTEDFTPTNVGLAFFVGFVGLLISAPIAAGYLKRLHRTVAGEASAGVFWKDARTYAGRVLLYFLVAGLVYLPSLVVLSLAAFQHRSSFASSDLAFNWQYWVGPLCLLFLCLTPVAVAADVPLLQALRRSVRLVWTHYLTALLLAVESALLCLVVLLPYYYVADFLRELWGRHSPNEALRMLPLEAAQNIALLVIGVWAVLALFVWYREAHAVAEDGPTDAPAAA